MKVFSGYWACLCSTVAELGNKVGRQYRVRRNLIARLLTSVPDSLRRSGNRTFGNLNGTDPPSHSRAVEWGSGELVIGAFE